MNEFDYNGACALHSVLKWLAKFLGNYLPLIIYSPSRNRNIVFHAIFSRPSKRFILPEILWFTITALMPRDDVTYFVKSGEERGESCRCWYPNDLPLQSGAAPFRSFLVIPYPDLMLRRFFFE